ncbi:MAG: PhnD/SsuA/transferrin family substrate-binding protein [Pseudomonadota bacterium]|nr:PhnD/SsuA/transferrin family substrate-binding protein [Pseudomonadota bacterium]MEE3100244.1 PhnD/SsuA/transferrin family substrate-binding protein [Pseudomonadota bacterium]
MLKSVLAGVAMLAAGASAALAAEPLKFAVTDVEGLEQLTQEFGAFEAELEKITGLAIDLYPVSSRTAAVEAMNSGQVDFVLTGPAEYVVIKALSNPVIVAGWQRPDYFAQVVALADGPVKTVEDLRGKVVTFGSVGSTSQHLGPAQALADLGLKLGEDYEARIVNRNVAVEAMVNGDVAAVGMNFGHLNRIREAFPDVAFQVVARGRDLPNDILVARADVDPAALETVRKAFVEHGRDLMASVLKGEDNQKYKGGFFLTGIQDSDYDYVRSMYKTIGIDTITDFVGD